MLSRPESGWMLIELRDEKTCVTIPVSYIQDPIEELLKIFINLLCYEEKCEEAFPIPSICFDGEGVDIIVTFLNYTTLVTILKDDAETVIIYKDWIGILKEFMSDINYEGFLQGYFKNFYYEDKASEENIKVLKNTLTKKMEEINL